jgi:hypothetical protein
MNLILNDNDEDTEELSLNALAAKNQAGIFRN